MQEREKQPKNTVEAKQAARKKKLEAALRANLKRRRKPADNKENTG